MELEQAAPPLGSVMRIAELRTVAPSAGKCRALPVQGQGMCCDQSVGGCAAPGRGEAMPRGSGPVPPKTCTVRGNSNSWFLLCERN